MKTVKLRDCCSLLTGGTPSKDTPDYWTGGIPWFSPKDIKTFELRDSQDHISPAAVQFSATRLVDPGTILVVVRSGVLAHTLPVGVVCQKSAFNQDIRAVLPSPQLHPEFVALHLKAHQATILREGVKRGATVHSLDSDYLEHVEIPAIDYNAQKRKVDLAKSMLAAADAGSTAVHQQLSDADNLREQLVSSALATASPTARATALLVLGEQCEKIGSGSTPRGGHKTYSATGVPLIRSQNVLMRSFAKDGLALIAPEIHDQMGGTQVRPRDVLLNITGASIGRVCIVPHDVCPANVNQHVCIIRCGPRIDPDFLMLFLSTQEFQKQISQAQAGGTRQALTKSDIERFRLPNVPLSDQQHIARAVTSQLDAIDRLTKAAQAQLTELNLLPARLLIHALSP